MSLLDNPIHFLSGIGEARAKLLSQELDIHTWGDLLNYFPFRYVDKSKINSPLTLNQLIGEFVLVSGVITSYHQVGQTKYNSKSARLEATLVLDDHQKKITLCWFQAGAWIEKTLSIGQRYVCFGRLGLFNKSWQITHPELETFSAWEKNPKKWQAVYSTTEKLKTHHISSKSIEKYQHTLSEYLHKQPFADNLPAYIVKQQRLLSRQETMLQIHAPQDYTQLTKAKERIKFEEVFWFQLGLGFFQQHKIALAEAPKFTKIGDLFNTFYARLNITLTNAQKNVIKEIRQDCTTGKPMNRLLQGDVGSGKTLVALMSMLIAIDNGFQACLVAPTEVLAQQHYRSISERCFGLPIHIALLTGNTKGAERTQILAQLRHGDIHILVGTHAVFEDKVEFEKLGLVVIDEQHRFGVEQRGRLLEKNKFRCHSLIMTATPIPRTLAMTMYSDLQVSVIDELPKGRIPIKTIHRWDHQRVLAYQWIKKEIEKGRQAYIVYPLIEESDKLQFEDLMNGYQAVKDFFDKEGSRISLVHGKQHKDEKDWNMLRFTQGKADIMVATTVIEVGVDVPNATVMLIESSQKFGLSQLHQLRGRVGRSSHASYCILMSPTQISEDAKKRIETMVATNDGFVIAEKDLELRGPGDMQGTKQSGDMPFKMLNLITDQAIIAKSKQLVTQILTEDPQLTKPEHGLLHTALHDKKQKNPWLTIG